MFCFLRHLSWKSSPVVDQILCCEQEIDWMCVCVFSVIQSQGPTVKTEAPKDDFHVTDSR